MSEYFILQSTYEVVLEFSSNTRPVRIEIFRSADNAKKLRARVWDQTSYNLYPTFANMPQEGGLTNSLMSCDEVNREITTILSANDPTDIIFGKEWESEEQFLSYLREQIEEYHATLSK